MCLKINLEEIAIYDKKNKIVVFVQQQFFCYKKLCKITKNSHKNILKKS
jgi:hypothetical protein